MCTVHSKLFIQKLMADHIVAILSTIKCLLHSGVAAAQVAAMAGLDILRYPILNCVAMRLTFLTIASHPSHVGLA